MNTLKVIALRELKSYFLSPLFYIIAFFFTLLLGITFSVSVYNFAQSISNSMMAFSLSAPQQQNIHYVVFLPHLSLVNLLFIFFIPALAMKTISEEKKNSTLDLLLTSPIKPYQIILGKFAALKVVILFVTIISLIYIFLMAKAFQFSMAQPLLSAFGIYLLGLLYASLNLFASSLTSYPLVAFILGVVFNLLIWMGGGFNDFIDSVALKKIIEQLSVNQHLQNFIEGAVSLNSFIFFITVILFFLFLTERVIESMRWRS